MSKSSHLADTSDPLTREALDWVIRLRSGEATVADAAAFRQWRARSPAHAAALREALRLWRAIGQAAQELRQETGGMSSRAAASLGGRHPGSLALDRRVILGGIAAAATAYVIVQPPLALWPSLRELGADYRTAKGERRRIVLGDNVVLHLNTQTSIAVVSNADRPQLDLLSGETAITAGTSVTVNAAGGRISATGATFLARCLDGVAAVTCVEGGVAVDLGAAHAWLVRGQQIFYSSAGLGSPLAVDPDEATAWQSGRLIFRDKPLVEVIAEVNRYRFGRIILTNASMGHRVVNGTFRLDRLDDALAQISQLFGARAVTFPGGFVFLG